MNNSKIKPEEINLLITVLSLPKEAVVYDPQNKLQEGSLKTVSNITTLLKQAGFFNVCVNLSGEALEISSFDFILEFRKPRPAYKSFFCESFLTINNPDGSIRWFQPAEAKQANFLNLYNGSGLKASFFKMAMKMAFSTRLQKMFCRGKFCLYAKEEAYFQKQFGQQEVAVFTGTIGENRKAVAALCEKGNPSHFIKIPISEKAKQLVTEEHQHLRAINELGLEKLYTPTAKMKTSGLQLTNIRPEQVHSSISIEEPHINALRELYAKTIQTKILGNLDAFKTVRNRLSEIKESINQTNGNLPRLKTERLAYNIKVLFNNFDAGQPKQVAYAHGDFTPWNMFVNEDRIHLYDWELAMPEQVLLYDVFHFVFQSSVLILHQPFSQIKLKIQQLQKMPAVEEIVERYQLNFWDCYRWYLLSNGSYYLNMYLKQSHLHKQAYWLLDCWIDASNDAIKTTQQKPVLVS